VSFLILFFNAPCFLLFCFRLFYAYELVEDDVGKDTIAQTSTAEQSGPLWSKRPVSQPSVAARAATVCPEKQVSRAVLNLLFSTSLPHACSSFIPTNLIHLDSSMCWGSFSLSEHYEKDLSASQSCFVTPAGLCFCHQRTHRLSILAIPSIRASPSIFISEVKQILRIFGPELNQINSFINN